MRKSHCSIAACLVKWFVSGESEADRIGHLYNGRASIFVMDEYSRETTIKCVVLPPTRIRLVLKLISIIENDTNLLQPRLDLLHMPT